MVFLGACNPQRRKTEKIEDDDNIGIKKDVFAVQRLTHVVGHIPLLYTVVPIPETMLEYVWDYGFLDDETENKYIKTMLNSCKLLASNSIWFDCTVSLIATSQRFFRNLEDTSSVSLRDVARFCRLYNWYQNLIIAREGNQPLTQTQINVYQRSTLMALLCCYYFRIKSSKDRQTYIRTIQEQIKSHLPNLIKTDSFLQELLRDEQNKLIDGMELPADTATNRALTDNIFVLVACIVNKIPVILCGKPGCSKTSSVQIIISNLKGKKSKVSYFRTLPELITVSYQGSQNCTSESVVKVFKRAEKYLQATNDTDQLLPVIVFDEIGLAELSPHNPLKVLHSELEVESCRYGFVGLSNWRLDASKMNRAIYVSCPEPDINDLQLTAKTILKSMLASQGQGIRLSESIIHGLADAYADLHQHIDRDDQYNNYFGLRDYYALIKGVVQDSIRAREDPFISIRRQLSVNFDGIFNGSRFMWNKFCQCIKRNYLINTYPSPKFKTLLDECLTRRSGRYLMLIAETESVIDYVERHIIAHDQTQSVHILTGSCFSGDLISDTIYTEPYNYRVLMDIILYAEANTTLLMRRMGHLYDNLYDLFNQNFAISAGKKYCRIPLGPLYHPRCLVHENFYCVVFILKQDLSKCDPPFLSRFEKHIIDMDTLIHPCQKAVTSELLTWLADLLATNINKHFPLLQHLFVNFNSDYICNLVIDAYDQFNVPIDHRHDYTDAVMAYCKDKLILSSSFDLPLVLSLRSGDKEKSDLLIEQYYDVHSHLSFSKLIEQTANEEQMPIPNQIIYTYTQLHDVINYVEKSSNVQEAKLGNFKTEDELNRAVRSHYQSTTQPRLLLIRVDYHLEHKHVLLLKHILLNQRIEHSNRGVWIIFHIQRNMLHQMTNQVLFNGWNIFMIENLSEHKLIPREILSDPSYLKIIMHEDFRLSQCAFAQRVDHCLTKFRYIVTHKQYEANINHRRDDIIKAINADEASLSLTIQEYLEVLINRIPSHFRDWRRDLLTNGMTIGASRSVSGAIQHTISLFYDNYLFLLFSHLEKHGFIDAYLFLMSKAKSNIHDYLESIWRGCLTSVIESVDVTMMNIDVMELALTFELHLPCARAEYEHIRRIRDMTKKYCEKVEKMSAGDENSAMLDMFSIDHLNTMSVYKENFGTIVQNPEIFEHYYHDQLLLALEEAKIHRLSTAFVQQLLTTNPVRTKTDLLKELLDNHTELIEILRLFETAIEVIGEDVLTTEVLKQQLIIDDPVGFTRNNSITEFYRLVMKEHHFYLVPPRTLECNDEPLECTGDPLIEVSLMNLIELVLSSTSIDRIQNIEQLNTAYGRIVQDILSLQRYSVDNLEKLRSFASLVRCITAVLPDSRALDVFKQACRRTNYDVKYTSCEAIHQFIDYLRDVINSNGEKANDKVIRDTLLKLENEFMKNWLVDHEDQYCDVLKSINRSDSDLWQYSARIFTVVDKKLNLLLKVKKNSGRILENVEELQQFDDYIHLLNDSTRKIERLMVNRIHMRLVLSVQGQWAVENTLKKEFTFFEENIRQIENEQVNHGWRLISLTAWLKYYTHLYAFALNNDSKAEVMENIDRLLTRDMSRFGSTLKLFTIKQLCQLSKVSVNGLRDIFTNRTCTWIRPIIAQSNGQQTQEIRHNLILPTPLFECHDEFIRVDNILSHHADISHLQQLIVDCSNRQDSAYCFFIWFIHFYSRFYMADIRPNYSLRQLIEEELSEEFVSCFEPIGHKLLIGLCTNFNNSSYFSLDPTMNETEVHQRMLVLNIAALLLSFKALGYRSQLGSLLFDKDHKMPQDYTQYLQTSVCLPGMICYDPVITQMIDVRAQVQERLRLNKISARGKYIFQCSNECLWMFYFENCGRANDRSLCPLCQKPIGTVQEGILIQRDPPQVQMTIEQAFEFIENYIEKFRRTTQYGYYNIKSVDESNTGEKPDHLALTISFRFTHMFTHAVLLFLHELDLLSNFTLPNHDYFREHLEKDYILFGQQLADSEQSIIWLFKVLNHMIGNLFSVTNFLDSNTSVIQLEKHIEQNLILPNIRSVTDEINQYKLAYANFVQKGDEEVMFDVFIDELREDEERYPFLNFFNITTVYTVNPLDEFLVKIRLIPDVDKTYPVTAFLMKRLDIYTNIQHLYSIVAFTNYLIEKYNYRIKRIDAAENTIDYYLRKDDPDYEIVLQLYKNFVHAWYSLTFDKVQFGCQTASLDRSHQQKDFAKHSKFATVLLNTSKDMSSIALAGCLRKLGELQNEIVNFYHGNIYADTTKMKRMVSLQTVQREHILYLDASEISTKLITNGFTINYIYGKSKEIIYDYEEIESTLRNMISGLPLIDMDNLHYLNYQFELYAENSSLINQVRARVKQELLDIDERAKLQSLIQDMSNDMILNYLGSLDYIFTYLSNIDIGDSEHSPSIEAFIRNNVSSAVCLNENVLRRPPFSTINLKHIIDLYELLEECAFDQILRNYIKFELSEESFRIEERTELIDIFYRMTLGKETLAECFRSINCWISMLKRLIIRVLMSTSVSTDVPLQLYLERTDLWTGNVTERDIQSIEVSDTVLLKHTYVILRGLERRPEQTISDTMQQNNQNQNDDNSNPQTSVGQIHQAKAWMPTTSSVPIEITEKKKSGKKLRDKN
ncbi:unnamed protein product [Adineta steineri]|uniref:Uncharacterized protein n=1 Tax=Adineta steineri TaxID=433720 RepID=A0A818K1S1_9BILA|nr:unnamed protein product [Adineta steineri]CAF3552312.1 unnamed protein product [Adineta steineri]